MISGQKKRRKKYRSTGTAEMMKGQLQRTYTILWADKHREQFWPHGGLATVRVRLYGQSDTEEYTCPCAKESPVNVFDLQIEKSGQNIRTCGEGKGGR